MASLCAFADVSSNFAADPAAFSNAPLNFPDGGRSVVKAVGSFILPVNDLDTPAHDSGHDFYAPLGLHTSNGAPWDIATADHDSKLIRVRQPQIGGGSTYTNLDITAANSPTDLAVADVDGDGKLDLVTCEAGQFVVRLNTSATGTAGDLSFAAPVTYSPGNDENGQPLSLNKICVADVDHDHLNDLIGVGTATVSGTGRIQLVVLKNALTSGGGFATPALYAADGTGDFVLAANLTRNDTLTAGGSALDWFPEVLVGSNRGDLATNGSGFGAYTTFINKGDGTFGTSADLAALQPKTQTIFLHIHALALGDINFDGNRDLIIEESNIGSGKQTFMRAYPGVGDGTFSNSTLGGTVFIGNNDPVNLFQGDLMVADLNGDSQAINVVLIDPINAQGAFVWAINVDDAINGTFFTQASRTTISSPGARAVTVTDRNVDNRFDLVIANDNANQLSIFDNAAGGGGGGITVPTGRGITFGEVPEVGEGDTFQVPVIRGSDSHGKVLEYVQFGGTAVQFFGNNKNADYQVLDPVPGQPIEFADDSEHVKFITIKALKNPSAEKQDFLTLTIGEPWGDAEVGDPSELTIGIVDGKPAVLKKPGALKIVAANQVKPTPQHVPFKVLARTGSDWTFSATQAFPADAVNARVVVQSTSNPTMANSWTDLFTLNHGKGNAWSLLTRHPPLSTLRYFRVVARADGYSDVFGPATDGYCIVAGPELGVQVSAHSDSDVTGDTVHNDSPPGAESITYDFKVTNAPTANGAATNAVLTVPIPAHATFAAATSNGVEVKDKGGKTTAVKWTFPSLAAGANLTVSLVVQVDIAAFFSKSELKKYPNGYGYLVAMKSIALDKKNGFNLVATAQGVTQANIVGKDEIDTKIIGALKLTVQPDKNSVNPGDTITYRFSAENGGAVALTGAVIIADIPAGTQLAKVYSFNNEESIASNGELPNPGPASNPAIIYVKADTDAKIDLTLFPLGELKLLAPIAKAKAGRVVNLGSLSAGTIKILIDDGFIAPSAVRWTMPNIPQKGSPSNVRRADLTVRIPYDAPRVDAQGQPLVVQLKNYDFGVVDVDATAKAGAIVFNPSALYKQSPNPIATTINNIVPAVAPHLAVSKCAKGDQNLNNPNFHGNGFSTVPGIGSVVTVVEHHGVDFEIGYGNYPDAQGDGADAHKVVLHDVIPDGMILRGFFRQSVNGGAFAGMTAEQFTFYDKTGAIIPDVQPGGADNMALVRSMDIRLGSVSNLSTVVKGDYGVVRYTCEAVITPAKKLKFAGRTIELDGPGLIHAFGGFEPALSASNRLQGFYITTSDQLAAVPGVPADLPVRVVADVSWDFPAPAISVGDSQPFDIVPFDFTFTQNGDVSAENTVLKFGVPQGCSVLGGSIAPPANCVVTFDRSTTSDPNVPKGHVVADGTRSWNFDPVFVGEAQPIIKTQSGNVVTLELGAIVGHSTHTVRVWFALNGPQLDPAIKAAGGRYAPVDPHIIGTYQGVQSLRERSVPSTRGGGGAAQVADAAAAGTNPMVAHDASPPKLGITRRQPFAVQKNSTFIYTIDFANHGDTAATNVTIGMQIPYRADFVASGTTNGVITQTVGGNVVPVANGHAYTTTPRDAKQLSPAGGKLKPGPDKVFWTFDSLPPQSTGRIELMVKCDERFSDEPIQDHSLFIKSDTTGQKEIADEDRTTWILGKSLTESKLQAAQTFFKNAGFTLTPELINSIGTLAQSLNTQSQIASVSGLDALHFHASGLSIFPLKKDQVMVVAHVVAQGAGNVFPLAGNQSMIVAAGAGNVVAQGAGNVVAQGGGNVVAQGAGNFISLSGVAGVSGTKNCSYLLDNIPAIVAAGAGNIVAAGAGNLIAQDGAGIVSNHPGGGIVASISQLAAGAIVDPSGRAFILNGGAAFAPGAPLIGHDGASLIGQDGAGLIGQDGAGLTGFSRSGSLIGQDGAGIVGHGSASALPEGQAEAASH